MLVTLYYLILSHIPVSWRKEVIMRKDDNVDQCFTTAMWNAIPDKMAVLDQI